LVHLIYGLTGENLTEAAQIADRWKGYCEDLCHDEEGKGGRLNGAGNRGITAENMEKSTHTDFNEVTTNKSAKWDNHTSHCAYCGKVWL